MIFRFWRHLVTPRGGPRRGSSSSRAESRSSGVTSSLDREGGGGVATCDLAKSQASSHAPIVQISKSPHPASPRTRPAVRSKQIVPYYLYNYTSIAHIYIYIYILYRIIYIYLSIKIWIASQSWRVRGA